MRLAESQLDKIRLATASEAENVTQGVGKSRRRKKKKIYFCGESQRRTLNNKEQIRAHLENKARPCNDYETHELREIWRKTQMFVGAQKGLI